MSLADIHYRAANLRAIADYDRLGQAAFLFAMFVREGTHVFFAAPDDVTTIRPQRLYLPLIGR
jgi:hypothetical protein